MTWFKDDFALPVREGIDTGGAQERIMRDFAGGVGGIRTVEEGNPDGSVTTLRTRLGRPIYETSQVRVISASAQQRGFVAKAPGGKAVLFDPYTLEVLQTAYAPAAKPYEVEDFPTGDTWYDVVLFDGTTIKINAKAMPDLQITADHSFTAMPYLINFTVGDQYGNVERNATEKRVFAVGRYSVTSWGGSGVTQTLTPTDPRTEARALTVGQRLDSATDTAYLGELYHGADGWDSATEWSFSTAAVQMLLASAYLVKTTTSANVAMTPPALVSVGTSSGSMSTDTTLPSGATIGLIGTPVHSTNTPYSRSGTTGNFGLHKIVWPWTGVITGAIQGEVKATYSRVTYAKSEAATVVQSGVTLNYSASNSKIWDSRNEQHWQKSYTHPFADSVDNTNGSEIGGNTTTLWWGQHAASGWDPSQLGAARGHVGKLIDAYPIAGSSVTARAYQEQSGSFVISTSDAGDLVHVTFSQNHSEGQGAVIAPKDLGYYDAYFLPGPGYGAGYVTIYYYAGSGLGTHSRAATHTLYSSPSSDITPAWENYKSLGGGLQDPSAVDDINAMYDAGVSGYMGQTLYDSEDSDGHYARLYYSASTNPSVTLDNNALTWTTKDFILYDPTNEVYITVEGSFTGVDNEAALTVLLKVQTRHHTTTQTLGEFSYTYTQMLPEREIGTTGKYAVPSPQIRAIFAPLYQEQGAFKGAHYVTKAEETGGIGPFHGFNFVLNLRMYSDFDTCNDDNNGEQVYFVPCNLLEMLYAFVFSVEMGVAMDGTRYPVTYTTRYEAMRDTLFSTPIRVSVRDGASTNWTSALGSAFAAIGTTALYRT